MSEKARAAWHNRARAQESAIPPTSQHASIELEPVVVSDKHALGVWRRFTVSVFDGVLGVEGLDELHDVVMRWRRAHPAPTTDLAVLHPTRAGMDAAERRAWLRVLHATEPYRAVGATVVLAQGLLGSMHRGIITSFNLLAPPPHPAKVFGDVDTALQWLAPSLQQTCGGAPLAALALGIDRMGAGIRAERARRA